MSSTPLISSSRCAAGIMDQLGIFLIARIADGAEHLPRHQFRKTDDRVQRRAQFVAHIGQEGGFGARCAHRHIARFDQRALLRLALGDVARHRHDLRRRALGPLAPRDGSVSPPRHSPCRRGGAGPRRLLRGRNRPDSMKAACTAARSSGCVSARRHRALELRRRTVPASVSAAGLAKRMRPSGAWRVIRSTAFSARKLIHGRALFRGAIGGALQIPGGGGNQARLDQRRQYRHRRDGFRRQRQARGRQIAQHLKNCHDRKRPGRRQIPPPPPRARPPASAASAGTRTSQRISGDCSPPLKPAR